MVTTFVVPLDGSPSTERAARIAATLAGSCDWEVEIVLAAVTSRRAAAATELAYLAEELHAPRVRCEVIPGDDVSADLKQVVTAAPAPVICMTTHGRGRAGGAIIGSTAEQLLRGVEVPFLLVGPHCDDDWSIESTRLLACLDESPVSDAVLHPASEWCRALGLELWLAEVFPPFDFASTLSAWRYTDQVAEHVRAKLPLVRTVSGWSRHPADEILHLRASVSACMIAMGTHGRSGLARVTLGSVTMAVVRGAPCPVLTIRPPGLA